MGGVGQLIPHHGADEIGGDRCSKAIAHGLHHRSVAGEDGGGHGLLHHGLDDLHLVDAALIVAVDKGVALTDVVQSFVAVQLVDALGVVDGGGSDGGVEVVLGIHLNAAQGVNDFLESAEVYPEVVVDVNAVVLGQGVLALIYAEESGVGELVG